MLEIDIKKFLSIHFGCSEGWFLRIWVSKCHWLRLLRCILLNRRSILKEIFEAVLIQQGKELFIRHTSESIWLVSCEYWRNNFLIQHKGMIFWGHKSESPFHWSPRNPEENMLDKDSWFYIWRDAFLPPVLKAILRASQEFWRHNDWKTSESSAEGKDFFCHKTKVHFTGQDSRMCWQNLSSHSLKVS